MRLQNSTIAALAGTLAINLASATEVPAAEIQHAAHLGSFLGEFLSAVAVALVALNMFVESRHRHSATKSHSYDHLDRAYHDLYATAAVHPTVLDPARTWNIDEMPVEERLTYEAYVWKAWVVCETIFDQTKDHPDVWQTWQTAIDIEARLHISWMLREITYRPDSFKKPLRDWLKQEYGDPKKLRAMRSRALARYARLRPATEADMPAIMDLERQGFLPGVLEREATFRERLEVFPEGFFVLTLGKKEELIGYVCAEIWPHPPTSGDPSAIELDHSIRRAHDSNGTCLYISSQTVTPSLRGAALGEFMFRECINRLAFAHPKLKMAYLIVSEEWRAARAIYDRCGFQLVEQVPGFFTPTGKAPECADVMRRQLPLDWNNAYDHASAR